MGRAYYIIDMDASSWYRLAGQLEAAGLEFTLFGFSNKQPHVFLSDEVAEKLRTDYHLSLDGPYHPVD